jgi:hypothetical protein
MQCGACSGESPAAVALTEEGRSADAQPPAQGAVSSIEGYLCPAAATPI